MKDNFPGGLFYGIEGGQRGGYKGEEQLPNEAAGYQKYFDYEISQNIWREEISHPGNRKMKLLVPYAVAT